VDTRVEIGAFQHLPYVRIGSGSKPLVVLTGLALDNQAPGRLLARTYGYGFRRLASEHTLYIVRRGRGLAARATGGDIAADHADALGAALGSFRLMGLSTGGLIAQHLALDHPRLVERLILVVSGAYLSNRGRDICRRWRDLAERRQWRRLRAELAAAAVDGPVKQRLAGAVTSVFAGGRAPTPAEAADFRTLIDADLAHDTSERLAGLHVPTLVVGGSDDPFFPDLVLRATAAAIPDASLRVYPGVGHGLPKHHGRRLQDDVLAFG
jgi:pimeloyl-ACP methyl ester carboxylesterase